MRHVGLEAERFRPTDHLQKIHHVLPAVHAAPADLALGRKALAMLLGDIAGFAEGLARSPSGSRRDCQPNRARRSLNRCGRRLTVGCRCHAVGGRCGTLSRPLSGTACAHPPIPWPSRRRPAARLARPLSLRQARSPRSCRPGVGCRPCSNRSRYADRRERDRRPRIWRRRPGPPPSASTSCRGRSAAQNRVPCRPTQATSRYAILGNCCRPCVLPRPGSWSCRANRNRPGRLNFVQPYELTCQYHERLRTRKAKPTFRIATEGLGRPRVESIGKVFRLFRRAVSGERRD